MEPFSRHLEVVEATGVHGAAVANSTVAAAWTAHHEETLRPSTGPIGMATVRGTDEREISGQ